MTGKDYEKTLESDRNILYVIWGFGYKSISIGQTHQTVYSSVCNSISVKKLKGVFITKLQKASIRLLYIINLQKVVTEPYLSKVPFFSKVFLR